MSTLTPTPRRSQPRAARGVYLRRRKMLVGFGLVLLVLGPLLVYLGMHRFMNFWNKPLTAGVEAPPVTADTKKFTVLLMGADDRPGEPGRSDTIMLGFVDLQKGAVNLLSIPRDSYVKIPGHGWDKINAAYAYGHEQLSRETLQQLIGMPIDYTFVINMQGFEKMVDTVGGVDINIEEDMDYDDPYDTPPLHIHLRKGLQHLDGLDALHYVRFRHDVKSDWGRMERQQTFLKALLHAAKGNLTSLPDLLKVAQDNVRTNLSPSQLAQLASLAKDKLGDQSIASHTLEGKDIWTSEGYYLGLDFAKMRTTVHQLVGEPLTSQMQAQDTADATVYEAGLPHGSSTAGGGSSAGGATTGDKPVTNTGTPTSGTPTAGKEGPNGTDKIQSNDGKSSTDKTAPGGKTGTDGKNGTATGNDKGAGSGAETATATGGSTGTTTGAATDTGATGGNGSVDAAPPWPVLIVDGSGGKQAALIAALKKDGEYRVLGVQSASDVQETTIIWYSGSDQAAYRLKVLVPNAKVIHMQPGPNDPPLKLVLGAN